MPPKLEKKLTPLGPPLATLRLRGSGLASGHIFVLGLHQVITVSTSIGLALL